MYVIKINPIHMTL